MGTRSTDAKARRAAAYVAANVHHGESSDVPQRPSIEQMCEGRDPDVYVLLDELAAHGYVIVHPDDVPRRKVWPDEPSPWEPNGDDQARGWNACRAHVFRNA